MPKRATDGRGRKQHRAAVSRVLKPMFCDPKATAFVKRIYVTKAQARSSATDFIHFCRTGCRCAPSDDVLDFVGGSFSRRQGALFREPRLGGRRQWSGVIFRGFWFGFFPAHGLALAVTES